MASLTPQDDVSLATAAKKRLERLERVMATQEKSRVACVHRGEEAAARAEAQRSQNHRRREGPVVPPVPAAAVCITPFMNGVEAAAGGAVEDPRGGQDSGLQQRAVPERLVPGSRDGAMYSGAFGRTGDLRLRMLQEQQGLISCNPIAFQEDMASQADAKYRCLIAVMGGGVLACRVGYSGQARYCTHSIFLGCPLKC